MGGLNASPISLRHFVGVYCDVYLIRICTLPKLKTFCFCLSSEIKVCVSFWPPFSKFVENTAAEI